MKRGVVISGLVAALATFGMAGESRAEGSEKKGAQASEGKASRVDEQQAFQQSVERRLDEVQSRADALREAGKRADRQTARELRQAAHQLEDELSQARAVMDRLDEAQGAEWIALHDQLEHRLDRIEALYEQRVMELPPETMASVLFPGQPAVEQRARAAERARAGEQQQEKQEKKQKKQKQDQEASLSESYERQLDAFSDRLDVLSAATEGLRQDERKQVRQEIQEMRADLREARQLAREMRQADSRAEWIDLHAQVEDALDDLSEDYVEAAGMVREQHVARAAERTEAGGQRVFWERSVDRLDAFEQRLDRLADEAANATGEARRQIEQQVDEMRERISEARERARQIPETQERAEASELREDVRSALEDLERDFDRLEKRIDRSQSR